MNRSNGRGLVAGACIGILVGMIIVFVIVRYLILLRRWITETKLGMHGKLSRKSKRPAIEDGYPMKDIPKSNAVDS